LRARRTSALSKRIDFFHRFYRWVVLTSSPPRPYFRHSKFALVLQQAIQRFACFGVTELSEDEQMPTDNYPYKNLVFEGGGVKGVAYAGVFEVLEQRQITPQIESVAGTSAGAITATMMALNYSADEFLKIMTTLNFEKFEDGCILSDLSGSSGILAGSRETTS
jgi:hypothetical protein